MNAGSGEHLSIIHNIGFNNITVQKEKRITLPEETLNGYLSTQHIGVFTKGKREVFSVTVYAENQNNGCTPGCCD